MRPVLIIRTNQFHGTYWTVALRNLNYEFVDAFSRSQIEIRNVDIGGVLEIYFRNVPLTDFRKIIFLGTPKIDLDRTVNNKEQIFSQIEFDAALKSALLLSRRPIINKRLLLTPEYLFGVSFSRSIWSQIGWVTTPLDYHYNSEADLVTSDIVSSETQCLITPHSTTFSNFTHIHFSNHKINEVIRKTQQYMSGNELEILSFQCSFSHSQPQLVAVDHMLQGYNINELETALSHIL